MRTQEQVLAQIEELKETQQDMFGFKTSTLLAALDFDHAKPFLVDDATKEKWEAREFPCYTDEQVKAAILDYMPFAWEKANHCRGLSAGRSIQRMMAWVWLLGDGFYDRLEESYENHYNYYGKPQLELICKEFGWDYKQWDDGKRRNSED